MHAIFDKLRNIKNLGDKDDSDLEELLQIQKDNLINDPSTNIVPLNGDMTDDGDADEELIEGELLQLQKDNLISDLSTNIVLLNGDMTNDGDTDEELIEGPGSSSGDPKKVDVGHDQILGTAQPEDDDSPNATRS